MNFFEMLKDYFVIAVMLICLCVGYILKNVVPTDKINKFIPLLLAVLGILLNSWINGWQFIPEVLLGGLASGLASSGAYDGYKGIKNYFNINVNTGSANDTEQLNE
ncbi:MAG: phage holin family protein [Candidatus Fimenecus sp.]